MANDQRSTTDPAGPCHDNNYSPMDLTGEPCQSLVAAQTALIPHTIDRSGIQC